MTSQRVQPSPLLCHVYQEHIAHFGEPDEGIVYDDRSAVSPAPPHMPTGIEVLIWNPEPDLDMTTLSTIGMSEKPMAGSDCRAELHFSIRKRLTPDEWHRCSLFLANIASYPFHYNVYLDWWHKLRDPGPIPLFPGASSVLFYPRFTNEGWDTICHDGETHVKLLNVMPISEAAFKLKSRDDLASYLWDEVGDPFTPW